MAHSLTRVTMTPQALERRRLKAAHRFDQGLSQAAIAKGLGVSRVAVHYWHQEWNGGGEKALVKKSVGPKSRLGANDRAKIERALTKGPAAYGYATNLWTLKRVRLLVSTIAHVHYGQTQVWNILTGLGWSCQKPGRRAKERDEKAIAYWRKVTWPAIKKRGSKMA